MKNRNLQLYILAWLVYIIFSLLGIPYMRITVMLFSIPLGMLGGWLYSYKGALITTVLLTPYHYLLLSVHSDNPAILIEAVNPFGIGSLLAFSLGAALLHSTDQRYHKLNAELEHIVAERTADLRHLADYLLKMKDIDRGIITSGLLDNPVELLTSIKNTSSRLCALLEEQKHAGANNAKAVHGHIQQCMEKLTEFLTASNSGSDPDVTPRENIDKLAEKMMCLGGGKVNIAHGGQWDHLDEKVAHQLYCIISEAVANAIRHANSTEIRIECRHDSRVTTICVENDGSCFPTRLQEGMGLPLMRHRAISIGGRLNIEGGPGKRTRVICTVPHKATAHKKLSQPDGQRLNTKT